MSEHDPTTHDETADRLRRALRARAESIEPAGDGLDRIEEQLMSRTPMTDAQKWILGGVAAVAGILAVFVLVLAGQDDDGEPVATGTSTTVTTVPVDDSTTTTTASTTTTVPAVVVDPFAVAFPSPADSRRFDAPVPAARAYATDVLGFTALTLGEIGGDTGDTAEVPISDRDGGAETRISLVRVEGSWFVTGSTTANVMVDAPVAGAGLATPFQTDGSALAFEGTVDVLVLEQGDPTPRGTGFVTGSGTPPAGPFSGTIVYSPPAEAVPGVLVYRILSPEDGRVTEATSFPVRLTTEVTDTPPAAGECPDVADEGEADPADRVVKVFFHCGVDFAADDVRALRRTVPADDPAILTNTMRALLAGPSDAERDAGFTSTFPVDGGEVRNVVIADGVATVDLSGAVAQNLANSSSNIIVLRQEVFRTATQFASVAAVEITFDGSCDAFATWSQSDSCLVTDGQ